MYYYEHENGSIIPKPDNVVATLGGPDIFFDSPFVKRWWHELDGVPAKEEGERAMIYSLMSPTVDGKTDVKFVEADSIEQAVEKLLRHAPNWRDRGSLNIQNHGAVVR